MTIPLANFLRPVEVLHYLCFRKLDLVWQQDTYFFAYIYDQGNKAQRSSSNSLPSPRGRAASFRIIGTMIRNAISGGKRYRGANKYKTALVFPFSIHLNNQEACYEQEESQDIVPSQVSPESHLGEGGGGEGDMTEKGRNSRKFFFFSSFFSSVHAAPQTLLNASLWLLPVDAIMGALLWCSEGKERLE